MNSNDLQSFFSVAVENGDVSSVRELLMRGIEVNAIDEMGRTALHRATFIGNMAMIECLCENGADIRVKDRDFHSAFRIAARRGFDDVEKYLRHYGDTPLHTAVHDNDIEAVRRLVVTGADVEALDNLGDAPLHRAALLGHVEIIRYLAEQGANLNAIGYDGESPLFRAVEKDEVDAVKCLVSIGAKANLRNTHGWAALHYAARHGHYDIVKHLCESGADIEYADKREESALSIGARYGHYKVTNYLLPLCGLKTIYTASKYEQQGMYWTFNTLTLDEHIRDYYINTSLLYPKEHSFRSSDDAPEDEHTAYINDPMLMARYSASSPFAPRKLWERCFGASTQSFYKVKEYQLPINYIQDVRFLKAVVYVSITLGRPEIFSNEVIVCAVGTAWSKYGRNYHIGLTAIYLVFLALFTISNYTFHDWVLREDTAHVATSWVLVALILLLNSFFILLEMMQAIEEFVEGRILVYLSDSQTVADFGAHIVLAIGMVFRCVNQTEDYDSSSVLAVATILVWLKLLYYLRPFKNTGPLVRMVFHIFNSIQELVIILTIVVFSFAQAMFLLSYDEPSLDFSDAEEGIINAFIYMMGQITAQSASSAHNPALAQFLLCVFVLVSSILLLNLLIAMMNSSYTKIKAQEFAEWNRERAMIMIEQFRPWPMLTQKYEYYLVREDDRKSKLQADDNQTDVRLERMEDDIRKVLRILNEKFGTGTDSLDASKQRRSSYIPPRKRLDSILGRAV